MRAENLAIEGLWLFTFPVHTDKCGFFRGWYKASEIEAELGRKFETRQTNVSSSDKLVLRGIHHTLGIQRYCKSMTYVLGAIWDFVVHLHNNLCNFRQRIETSLDGKRGEGLYKSEGLGHRFQSLENKSKEMCSLTSLYSPDVEYELNSFDSELDISWPTDEPILSEKDSSAPSRQDLLENRILP